MVISALVAVRAVALHIIAADLVGKECWVTFLAGRGQRSA